LLKVIVTYKELVPTFCLAHVSVPPFPPTPKFGGARAPWLYGSGAYGPLHHQKSPRDSEWRISNYQGSKVKVSQSKSKSTQNCDRIGVMTDTQTDRRKWFY